MIVRESIEFKRTGDPKRGLNIGEARKIYYPFDDLPIGKYMAFVEKTSGEKMYNFIERRNRGWGKDEKIDFSSGWFRTPKEARESFENEGHDETVILYSEGIVDYVISTNHMSESMDFKRGIDPRSSMGIGIEAIRNENPEAWKEYIERTMERDLGEFTPRNRYIVRSKDKSPIWVEWFPKAFGGDYYDHDSGIEMINIHPDNPRNWDKRYQQHFKRRVKEWLDKNTKYKILSFRKDKYVSGYTVDVKWEDSVNETIEFKRGQDPKKALGLGMNSLSWIKEIQRRLDLLDPENLTALDEDSGDGIPVLYYKGFEVRAYTPSYSGSNKQNWMLVWDEGNEEDYFDHPMELWVELARLAGIPENPVYESIGFKRDGDVKKGLDVGWDRKDNLDIRRFMEPTPEMFRNDAWEWMSKYPPLLKALEIKDEQDHFENIVGFETDSKMESMIDEIGEFDEDEVIGQFIPESPWILRGSPGNQIHFQRGKTDKGHKMIAWKAGHTDGFLARKEWLK